MPQSCLLPLCLGTRSYSCPLWCPSYHLGGDLSFLTCSSDDNVIKLPVARPALLTGFWKRGATREPASPGKEGRDLLPLTFKIREREVALTVSLVGENSKGPEDKKGRGRPRWGPGVTRSLGFVGQGRFSVCVAESQRPRQGSLQACAGASGKMPEGRM